MRTRAEFLSQYAISHRNFTNQIIHLICVPLIYFASAGLFWSVKINPSSFGVDIPAFNLAVLLFVPVLLFYAQLGFGSLMTGLLWSGLSVLASLAIENSGASLPVVCAVIWIGAWIFQFVGHHIEKAKPSFGDDLVFLLIGPLFVQIKLEKILAARSLSVLRQA